MPNNFILEQIEIRGEPLISQNNLKFKDGLNIIAGHTGTGKTMILKIINFLVNPSDKKESFLSNAKIKYSLNSKAFGLEQETIEVVITENEISSSSNLNYENIQDKIKILYINHSNIIQYLNEKEFYETISQGQRFSHVVLELTEGVENSVILLDDIVATLDMHKRYLFFKYLMHLSEENQVFLTLQPHFLYDLRNYLAHIDLEVLNYLRQSQVLYLRGFWQKTIIDYFKEEPVSDYLEEFHQNIRNIKKILSLQVHEQETRRVLDRIMYANVITVMETYLSECFTRLVIENKSFKLKLIELTPEFNTLTFNLRDAYDWLDDIDTNIIEKIQSIVFHNLDKVISMFKNVLGIKFLDDMGDIFRAINNRHDIIHRNGKTKDGNELRITKQDVLGLISKVEELIEHIERQDTS